MKSLGIMLVILTLAACDTAPQVNTNYYSMGVAKPSNLQSLERPGMY